MTKEFIGTAKNAYISVELQPLADGRYKVLSFKKLRSLDDETRRVYDQNTNVKMAGCETLYVSSLHIGSRYVKAGSIVGESFIQTLKEAGESLLAIEKRIKELECSMVTVFVGGRLSAKTVEQMRVVDCRHSDGSVYSWKIRKDDGTEYKVDDIVEVEHLGFYRNEYLPVVRVRTLRCDETPPACEVVRQVEKNS